MVQKRALTAFAFAIVKVAVLIAEPTAGKVSPYGFEYQNQRGKNLTAMPFPATSAPNAPYGVYEYYYTADDKDRSVEPNRAIRDDAAAYCKSKGTDWNILSLHSDAERDYVLSQGTPLSFPLPGIAVLASNQMRIR